MDSDLAGLIEAHSKHRSAGNLQVKTCSAWLLDDWREGPPPKYEIQCRVEMAVTGLPWTDLVCLCGGQRYLGPFRIDRDLALEERILAPLREFWDMVIAGVEPTVDHTDNWRLHVSEKMERSRAVLVKADTALRDAVSDWRNGRRVRILSEREEDKAKNNLLLRLSAAGGTRIDADDLGKITAYRTGSGTWALKTPTAWKEDV
jgi:predicted phage-related endonuclease